MKKVMFLCQALTVVLIAAGCSGGDAPSAQSPIEPEKNYVTAFGTVECARSLSLTLPFTLRVESWYVREGQQVVEGDPVLRLDTAALSLEAARLEHERDALAAEKENCARQLEQARADVAALRQAVDTLDPDALLDILINLANANTRDRKDPYEAELLAYLQSIASVSHYQQLLSLTLDKNNTRDNARPALLALEDELAGSLAARQAEVLTLTQRLHNIEAQALTAGCKTDIMEAVRGGEIIAGIGRFDGDGVLTAAAPLLLMEAAPSEQDVPAGGLLASFGDTTFLEISLHIEEQLIQGVREGQDVQLSPLYDKSVVWLGTVAFVADRAILINGETVVPVVVTADGELSSPGYNVVAKILTGE